MSPDTWQKIQDVFNEAADLPAESRSGFLDSACGQDHELRHQVEALLTQRGTDVFLEQPALKAAIPLAAAHEPWRYQPGCRVASYEVLTPIGAGGMGQVYRARDIRLNRTVAIKVLSDNVIDGAGLRQRLKREAEAIAALNHPHVCTLYDLGTADGVDFLVMEYVEGQTLSERLARGHFTVKEALEIARQIAEGLEAAHEKGIVHRDLKPSNVKITEAGSVKVLDFGIAKMLEAGDREGEMTSVEGTATGTILGTVAYMSPEQARGLRVDRRADIWAFGCVLYEMLTGKKLFAGETVSDTLAAVLTGEPDWKALPEDTPSPIRILLRRCLERDPQRRLPHIGAARIEIEDVQARPSLIERTPSVGSSRWAWSAVALIAVAFTVATRGLRERTPETPPQMRVDITTPSGLQQFALSPDGKNLVFVASVDGSQRLWLRRLDQTTTAQPLPGTESAQDPFWSPDSKSIGFVAGRQLKRLDVLGGSPVVLTDAGRGGSWNTEGVILFIRGADLYRIKASGEGETQTLQIPGAWIRLPQFLPDGKRFLFCVYSGPADIRGTYLASLDESTPKRLGPAEDGAAWLPPDRVVFMQQGNLWARRLDLKQVEWLGDAEPITDSVAEASRKRADFSVSAVGSIAYRRQTAISQLTWLDRQGQESGKLMDDGNNLQAPELSPDGKSVVFDRTVEGNRDVFLIDLVRGGMNRLTTDKAADGYPVWFPDGRIAFETNRRGDFDIYVKPSSGVGQERALVELPGQQWPQDVSRDGKFLLYQGQRGLWARPLTGDDQNPFSVASPATNGQFSPDGRLVAFETTEPGRVEVVVQPFPEAVERWKVSTAGGWWPRWSPDGKELYFVADGKLMASSIHTSGASLEAGPPKYLFEVQLPAGPLGHPEYAVSRDGRFLVNQFIETGTNTPITLI